MSSSSQNPKPRRRVASLGTPCGECGHSRNWHRYEDDSCSQCQCREFAAAPPEGGAS